MTITGSAGQRGTQRTRRSRETDRTSWAGHREEVHRHETSGIGQAWLPAFVFKAAFEGRPQFSYGVVSAGQDLTGELYAMAGVFDWQTYQIGEGRATAYLAARVWVGVDALEALDLQWTFRFSGVILRSRTGLHIPSGDQGSFPPVVPPPETPEPEAPVVQGVLRHTTYFNKLWRRELGFQSDALLRATVEVSHVADVVAALQPEVVHTADVLILTGKFHTTDLVLLATQDVTHSTDAVTGDQAVGTYSATYEETY